MSRINLTTNVVDVIVGVGHSPVGVAVNPAGTFAYVANTDSNTVSRINLATNAMDVTMQVGRRPAGVAINPAGTFAYVTNYAHDTVSKVSLTSVIPELTTKRTVMAKTLATYAHLTVPNGAKIALKVAPTSAKNCQVSGTSLNGLKPGSCMVTITVLTKVGTSDSATITLNVIK